MHLLDLTLLNNNTKQTKANYIYLLIFTKYFKKSHSLLKADSLKRIDSESFIWESDYSD